MPYVSARDGTPLYLVDKGEGRPIVLLQGLMLTVDGFWAKNLGPLSLSNRVVAIDHRSHGQSGKPLGPHSIKQCASDLKDVLEALDLKDVCLAGSAFGAMVMLEYLRHYGPARLAKLGIIEAQVRLTNAPGWEHPTFGDFPAEAGAGFIAGCRASREPLTGFIHGLFGTPPSAEDMSMMQAQAWLTPTQAAIEYVEDMVAADYRADIAKIQLPTMFMYGRKNNAPLPTELGRWLHEQLPGSKLVLFTESGHSPFWEEPGRFNAELAAFANA